MHRPNMHVNICIFNQPINYCFNFLIVLVQLNNTYNSVIYKAWQMRRWYSGTGTPLLQTALGPVFLISSYGAPLTHRSFYLALHSSLLGPVAQLIMIILSLTALTLSNWLKMYSPMAHTLTIFEPIWPKLQS